MNSYFLTGPNYRLSVTEDSPGLLDDMPVSPEAIADILSFGIKGSLKITFNAFSDGEHIFGLKEPHSGTDTAWLMRPDTGTTEFYGWSGSEITRQLFANRLALSTFMDCPDIMSSFEKVGAYAFARYGFIPDHETWDILRNKITRILDSACNVCNTPQQIKQRFKDILKSGDPKSIWDLVDYPLKDKDGNSFGSYLILKAQGFWDGKFNIENPQQMKRAENYVGPERFRLAFENALNVMGNTPQIRYG